MALRHLLAWIRPSGPRPGGPPGPSDPGLDPDRQDPEWVRIHSELQALERAAEARRREWIPDTLRQPSATDPEAGGARELLRMARRERRFFQELLAALQSLPGWAEAGARIRPPCQAAFDLSGFYLARADWDAGLIRFPYFFEAGRSAAAEPLPLDPAAGLTGWGLHQPGPCYLDSLEACLLRGMRLTEAEQRSGLWTRSWFGAPLPGADPARPLGLMAFHCYHADAFGPDRRRLLALTARLTAMHFRAEAG